MSIIEQGKYVPYILQLAAEAGVDMFEQRYESDQEAAAAELQDRYFPDSWMLKVGLSEKPIASYRVICSTPAELALAYALRPIGVNAAIVLEPKST